MNRQSFITYTYRGRIERGTGQPGYSWQPGYSETTAEGKALYPWMTYRECLKEAKARGAAARFIDESAIDESAKAVR